MSHRYEYSTQSKVVLRARPHKVLFFLAVCKAIYTGLGNHPALFPTLPVLLSVVLSQIQAVEARSSW